MVHASHQFEFPFSFEGQTFHKWGLLFISRLNASTCPLFTKCQLRGERKRTELACIKYKLPFQVFCRREEEIYIIGSEVMYLPFTCKKALVLLFGCNEFLNTFVLLCFLSHPLVGWMEGKDLCWSSHSIALLKDTCHRIFLLWAALPTFPLICFLSSPHGFNVSKSCCFALPLRFKGTEITPSTFLFPHSNTSPCGENRRSVQLNKMKAQSSSENC